MAPLLDISAVKVESTAETKSSKSESKPKKDKSSKKRKAEQLDGASMQHVKLEEAPTVSASESAKRKKEKSSKKRKSEALDEVSQKAVKLEEASTTPDAESESPAAEDTSAEPPSKKRKSALAEEIEVDITAPEPPSKKALRLLKKGKPLPPSKSGADSPEPEAKKKKAEVEKRSEHGVWIGNLPFHVSQDDLRKFFVEYSDITPEMITRVHMPGPNDSKPANKVEAPKKYVKVVNNKGFAYVDFSTAAAVGYAVEVSEQLLSGRRVLIKDNKSFEGRPQKTKEESRNDGKPPSTRIFVGNLSFDTTEESLTEHFEKCGTVVSCKVAAFEDSGKCKGYGWIVFEELEGAKNAVKGFVIVEEEESDESEDEEMDENSDSDADSEAANKPKLKKTKKRKVWVNRIKGRPLRMEFAEDAQVRYKKRYGKDGSKSKTVEASEGAAEGATVAARAKEAPKKTDYMLPYGGAHLTGGIVESKGTKVTF